MFYPFVIIFSVIFQFHCCDQHLHNAALEPVALPKCASLIFCYTLTSVLPWDIWQSTVKHYHYLCKFQWKIIGDIFDYELVVNKFKGWKLNRPLARLCQTSKQPEAHAALWEFSGVADRMLTHKHMAEVLVLFREVDIIDAVLPEKVIDMNTSEALRRWISYRGLTYRQ